jgi:hypothetical protein
MNRTLKVALCFACGALTLAPTAKAKNNTEIRTETDSIGNTTAADTTQLKPKARETVFQLQGAYLTPSLKSHRGYASHHGYKSGTGDGWFTSLNLDRRIIYGDMGFLYGLGFGYGQLNLRHTYEDATIDGNAYMLGVRLGLLDYFGRDHRWNTSFLFEFGCAQLRSDHSYPAVAPATSAGHIESSWAEYGGMELSVGYRLSRHWGLSVGAKVMSLSDHTWTQGTNASVGNQNLTFAPVSLNCGVTYQPHQLT